VLRLLYTSMCVCRRVNELQHAQHAEQHQGVLAEARHEGATPSAQPRQQPDDCLTVQCIVEMRTGSCSTVTFMPQHGQQLKVHVACMTNRQVHDTLSHALTMLSLPACIAGHIA